MSLGRTERGSRRWLWPIRLLTLGALVLLIAAVVELAMVPRRLQQNADAAHAAHSELELAVRPALALTSRLPSALDRQLAAVRGYLLNRDVDNKERYKRARAVEDSLLMQLAPIARDLGPQVIAQVDDVRARAARWHADQDRLLLEEPGYAPQFMRRLSAQLVLYDEALLAAQRLDDELGRFEGARVARIAELRRAEPDITRALTWVAAMAAIIAFGLAWTLSVLAKRPPVARLRESQQLFDQLAGSIQEVFWTRDAESGRFTYVSPGYEAVWGRSRDPLYAGYGNFLATLHPEDRARVEAADTAHAGGGRASERPLLEYRIIRPDGSTRWIAERSFSMPEGAAKPSGWIGIAADVTERFAARKHLAHLALHDPLTGLGNHLLFLERLEHAVDRVRRSGALLALLVVELEGTEATADEIGGEARDEALKSVANRLRDTVRSEDTLVRLGDEQFAVLFERIQDRAELIEAAKRVSAAFEAPFSVGEAAVDLRAQVAVAMSRAGSLTAAGVARLADVALGEARLGQTEPFEIVERDGELRVAAEVSGESQLRQALAASELRVLYQPVLDLQTDAAVGVEALIRWAHPDRGLLLPGEFLPLAEESGLIHPIGLWVLRTVCSDLREWQTGSSALADLWVAVNLSGVQFELPEFAHEFARIVDEAGALSSRLRVDVDETTWFRARRALRRLQKLGVRVTVDGFGERYGALGALTRLPVDGVKLTRALGFGPADGGRPPVVAASIADSASSLGLEVAAVGVESAAEARILRAIGCGAAQGFYFSEPLDSDSLQAWLAGGGPRKAAAALH